MFAYKVISSGSNNFLREEREESLIWEEDDQFSLISLKVRIILRSLGISCYVMEYIQLLNRFHASVSSSVKRSNNSAYFNGFLFEMC
jgi:hypothetical protein